MPTQTDRVRQLVALLNQYRNEYYNENNPSVTDAVYDCLYDELLELERETGVLFSSSPTQTVGCKAVSTLPKVKHPVPLLSLDKTKQTRELAAFLKGSPALLMLKLDGLTIKMVYEDGKLTEGSTRGDGEEGEVITHNVPAFCNVPLSIPYKGRLVIIGEGLIHKDVFESLKGTLLGSDGKPYRNARNLASGSIRCLDAAACKERKISFYAFNVLEGLDESDSPQDSRYRKLMALCDLGFETCPLARISPGILPEELELQIKAMTELAGRRNIPIDGMVLRFDSFSYSASLGRTGHHYNDGIAFKFADDVYETVFRSIEWQTGRSGEIAPVAIFDTVDIDGCDVSKASLHNLSFIKRLELYPGCRILVSKRNMIIPHVEENLERGAYQDMTPETCPCCGKATRIHSREAEKGRLVETLHCDNHGCWSRILHKFVHFAEKKAMDIKGISEATLRQLIPLCSLNTYQDLYHLDRYREQIITLEGFGEKSYENLAASINESRRTTFVRYLVAVDIPLIGRTASRVLDRHFRGNLREFELAAVDRFDFTCLEGIGSTMSGSIHEWFRDSNHLILWRTLQKEFTFENNYNNTQEEPAMSENKNNPFTGCTIVATGKLESFTRDGINSMISSLGAAVGSSVTQKTDYLICGEKAGGKLAKAQQLGVTVLTEQQFLDMMSA